MDLRKGSEVKDGKRRCIRCSGRKKMYQLGKTGIWTHDNSGGVLKDCPLCLGVGLIDKVVPKIEESQEEITNGKKRTLRKIKENHTKKIIISDTEKEY